MIRSINVLLTITSVLALSGVYMIKFSIEGTASEKIALESHIRTQESDLSLLQADWAVLNQPGHVEPIVRRHIDKLAIAQVQQAQFGSFTAIPMRPAAPDSFALDALFLSLDAGVDPIAELIEEN